MSAITNPVGWTCPLCGQFVIGNHYCVTYSQYDNAMLQELIKIREAIERIESRR